MSWTVHLGDSLAVLKTLPDSSVDAVVTDPPYGLAFMGKKWDYDVPGEELWRECLRVLKPGGHLLAFAGTRTQHRMAVRIEDAGFEIRDMVAWVYGSGFPKSLDVSKALDKIARRDYIGAAVRLGMEIPGKSYHDWTRGEHAPSDKWWAEFKDYLSDDEWMRLEREVVGHDNKGRAIFGSCEGEFAITAPATPAAKEWQGWGTALKPSFEPITMARKPLGEGTVAANVLAWGVGGINVDGCRVEADPQDLGDPTRFQSRRKGGDTWDRQDRGMFDAGRPGGWASGVPSGRWPANLVHDGSEEVVGLFPVTTSGGTPFRRPAGMGYHGASGQESVNGNHGDTGSAARFFASFPQSNADRFKYCAKASRREREAGCEGLEERDKYGPAGQWNSHDCFSGKTGDEAWRAKNPNTPTRNGHPTVKPIALMRWLCRLVTPPGGLVLDPFMGSGTTGCAAMLEGFNFVGIEREPEYIEIARRRITYWAEQAEAEREADEEDRQLRLLG